MESEPLDILLIEDNPTDALLLEEMLNQARASYRLTHEHTLAAGLDALAGSDGSFDVVLLDLGLPDSKGLGTLERLLSEVETVPVIALTGLDDSDVAVKAVQEGAQDYLPKGQLDGPQLLRAIRYARERARLTAELDLLAKAMEQTAESIVITDARGKITYVNPTFTELSGYTSQEALGELVDELLDSGQHDQPYLDEIWETIRGGEAWSGRLTVRRKDGSAYISEKTITPVRGSGDRITHFVSVGHDITEEIEREHQQQHRQRLESIGQLAGGVAHDFNNQLTAIRGYCELVKEGLPPSDPLRRDVAEIEEAASRAAVLTRQLLAFGRKQHLSPKAVDLNERLERLHDMMKRLIREDVELEVRLASDPARVRIDPVQLEHVVVNLLVNARDALPDGGVVRITTGIRELDESHRTRFEAIEPGEYVQLEVSDDGRGMPPEVLEHVFEPFFTTKPSGEGTGLGLSMVYGIVKQSGGHIWAESEPGQATTFKILLPRLRGGAQTKAATRERAEVESARGESVLIVEDEPAVRRLARRVLERYDYSVVEAASGPEAIELVATNPGAIDLLLTDVVMPKMSGPELAEELTRRIPDLKVLYMSGYTGDTNHHRELLEPGMPLVSKPFAPQALASKVRELLDQDPADSDGSGSKQGDAS